MAEYQRIGATAFLKKYKFQKAKDYHLLDNGERYECRAILAAAYCYEHPDKGPLTSKDFGPIQGLIRQKIASFGFSLAPIEEAGPVSDKATALSDTPAYLLNWRRGGDWEWKDLENDAAKTRAGEPVSLPWWIYKQTKIRVGDRVFVLAQGGKSDGLLASGYAAQIPEGKTPVDPGVAVYEGHDYKDGNYITVELDCVLRSDDVLPLQTQEETGDLRLVPWKNVQSPGIRIRPRRNQDRSIDVLPELEKLWAEHLEKVKFPVPTPLDPLEVSAAERFGTEGTMRYRMHRFRERNATLVKEKKADALRRHLRLQCEVCEFDFAERYPGHGSDFIECHHREPLSNADGGHGISTTLKDLALVCSNCHRMLHWNDWPDVDELRRRLLQTP